MDQSTAFKILKKYVQEWSTNIDDKIVASTNLKFKTGNNIDLAEC